MSRHNWQCFLLLLPVRCIKSLCCSKCLIGSLLVAPEQCCLSNFLRIFATVFKTLLVVNFYSEIWQKIDLYSSIDSVSSDNAIIMYNTSIAIQLRQKTSIAEFLTKEDQAISWVILKKLDHELMTPGMIANEFYEFY